MLLAPCSDPFYLALVHPSSLPCSKGVQLPPSLENCLGLNGSGVPLPNPAISSKTRSALWCSVSSRASPEVRRSSAETNACLALFPWPWPSLLLWLPAPHKRHSSEALPFRLGRYSVPTTSPVRYWPSYVTKPFVCRVAGMQLFHTLIFVAEEGKEENWKRGSGQLVYKGLSLMGIEPLDLSSRGLMTFFL